MKQLGRILSLLILVSTTVVFTACKDDDPEKSETDAQIEKLVGTWTATSATFQGNPNADYENAFKLTITGAAGAQSLGFTTTGRPQGKVGPWPGSGTFTFGTPVISQLIRDDNVTITYSVNSSNLSIDFNFTGDGYASGRTESIEGLWEFEFEKSN